MVNGEPLIRRHRVVLIMEGDSREEENIQLIKKNGDVGGTRFLMMVDKVGRKRTREEKLEVLLELCVQDQSARRSHGDLNKAVSGGSKTATNCMG